ncbi:hypothetical protein N0V90_003341 [Kalmusia sp. IMI 367209]|nr:hypothetical protein N0V90_003341 [Kalmusia sp. IMI 367209]
MRTALDSAFTTGNTSHGSISVNDTYSIQIFSAYEESLFEFYHTGANVVTPVNDNYEIDGDAVYRIASAGKLYTVYLLLIVAGDAVFAESVTKYLPELAGVAHWDEVTVGALAGYIGGVSAECYIIEIITGQSFSSALQTSLIEPLGLSRTFASTPDDESIGVILYDATTSGWNVDISEVTAMGGIFASASDVSAIGRSILSSKLLASNTTRAWLKPTSFTSSPAGFVGRPWEIYRATIDLSNNRVVDIYTKAGNFGVYGSILALVPDFDIGFTILMASEARPNPLTIAGVVTDILLPAVEEAARVETHAAYADTYTSPRINSSVTISSEAGKPGLSLESWISNGTDMFPIFGFPDDFRLYPSNVGSSDGDKKRVSWKAVSGLDSGSTDFGTFAACPTWFGIDRPGWGLWGLDDWVFVLEEGVVSSVEIAALKVVLERDAE